MVPDLAKWLVPSITVLFVTIGYVVELAHQDLLGVELAGSSSDYVTAAAGFFRDLATIGSDLVVGVFQDEGISLRLHRVHLLAIACLGVVVVVLVRRTSRAGARYARLSAVLVAVVLLGLIGLKFVYFDAPLTKIDSVIVGAGEGSGDAAQVASLDDRLDAAGRGGALGGAIARRARATWVAMICSRVSKTALERVRPGWKDQCQDEHTGRAQVVGEFVAQSIAAILLIAVAGSVLRHSAVPGLAALAVLALAYGLMWPYAYGKLMKSTMFEYGEVVFNPALPVAAPAPDGNEGDAGRIEHAIVLSHGAGGATLLVLKVSECPGPEKASAVKLWSVANAEVAAIREIYREDVLTWKTLNEKRCAGVEPPV